MSSLWLIFYLENFILALSDLSVSVPRSQAVISSISALGDWTSNLERLFLMRALGQKVGTDGLSHSLLLGFLPSRSLAPSYKPVLTKSSAAAANLTFIRRVTVAQLLSK